MFDNSDKNGEKMILEKFKKVKNPMLLRIYPIHNDHCEYCYYIKNDKINEVLEIHHIFGGVYRSDELWNIIMLCNSHHSKIHGKSGIYKRSDDKVQLSELLAIKLIKREIIYPKVLEILYRKGKLGLSDEISDIHLKLITKHMGRVINGKKQIKI